MKNATETDSAFITFLGGESRYNQLFGSPQQVNNCALKESTLKAYHFVQNHDSEWIKKIAHKIEKDSPNANSYLGELRAYADILKLPFFKITPSSEKNGTDADFLLTNSSTNERVKIEVYTQLMKPNCIFPDDSKRRVIQETVVTPLINWEETLPKVRPSDISITKGSILNIAGEKKKAKQVDPQIPTYLFIDFQNIFGLSCDQALPILSGGEFLTTGVCWMAFYGRKGMPIIERMSGSEPLSFQTMGSDGFFWNSPSSKFAGALLRFSQCGENPLVFLENPCVKTPDSFLLSLIQCGLMNVEKSCWSLSGIRQFVCSSNKRICDVVKFYAKRERILFRKDS